MKLAFLFLFVSSVVRAQSLSQEAFSSEWLQLLHMRKTWTGHYESSVRGQGFFLSSKGAQDPEAELQETARLMFSSDEVTEQKHQCQFLARRDFLLRKGPAQWKSQIKTCQFSQEWLGQLNARKISLIFASGYMNSAASSFGHTFLKLQNPSNEGGRELLDYGVNFAARTEDTQGALYALYGLFGIFPGTFSMLPYHQMIKEYTHLEGRDLWEYELDFTEEEVQRVIFHLLELEKVYFDYYFLDSNCSYALLKAVEVGRPGLRLLNTEEFFVIPIDTVKIVQPIVRKVTYRPSLETEWQQRKQKLGSEDLKNLNELYSNPQKEKLKGFSTQTLSAAQYLFTLKEHEDRQKWKDFNYEISSERARRSSEKENFQIQRPEESPEQGPDSSAVEVGFLDRKQSYLLSGIRLAFHDQMSRNVGASPFSHLEVLSFQWESSRMQQTRIRQYRLLETLSTKAIDGFEKPISWGVLAGADQDLEFPSRLRHQISGRFGYSFDFWPDRFRWTFLASIGLHQDSAGDFQLTPGFDSRLWILWSPFFRSFFQNEYLKFPSFDSNKTSLFQVFDLTKQLELRLGWQSHQERDQLQIEKKILLMQNFLL